MPPSWHAPRHVPICGVSLAVAALAVGCAGERRPGAGRRTSTTKQAWGDRKSEPNAFGVRTRRHIG
jgi:hypothetical protein